MRTNFDIDLSVVYTTTRVSSLFPLKSKTTLPILSSVVYKFTSLGDQTESYIGMAERHVSLRVRDHLRLKSATAVAQHIKSCRTCQREKFSLNDFKIIKKCRTDKETKIYEALEINSKI